MLTGNSADGVEHPKHGGGGGGGAAAAEEGEESRWWRVGVVEVVCRC